MSEKFGTSNIISDVGKPHEKTTKEDMPQFLQNFVGKWVHIPPACARNENYLHEQVEKERDRYIK